MDYTAAIPSIITGLISAGVVIAVLKNELKHVWKGIERLDREDRKIWKFLTKLRS